MAFSIYDNDLAPATAEATALGFTLAFSPTSAVPVGKLAVLMAVWDNTDGTNADDTTFLTVTDSKGNTWIRAAEAQYSLVAALDGILSGVFYSVISTQIETSDTITLTHSSGLGVSKALTLCAFNRDTARPVLVAGKGYQRVAGSTSYTVTVSGLTSEEHLWVGQNGQERTPSDTNNKDADFLDIKQGGAVFWGTGSGFTVVGARGGYLISTGTTETYNNSGLGSADRVTILVAFAEGRIASSEVGGGGLLELGGVQHLSPLEAVSGSFLEAGGFKTATPIAEVDSGALLELGTVQHLSSAEVLGGATVEAVRVAVDILGGATLEAGGVLTFLRGAEVIGGAILEAKPQCLIEDSFNRADTPPQGGIGDADSGQTWEYVNYSSDDDPVAWNISGNQARAESDPDSLTVGPKSYFALAESGAIDGIVKVTIDPSVWSAGPNPQYFRAGMALRSSDPAVLGTPTGFAIFCYLDYGWVSGSSSLHIVGFTDTGLPEEANWFYDVEDVGIDPNGPNELNVTMKDRRFLVRLNGSVVFDEVITSEQAAPYASGTWQGLYGQIGNTGTLAVTTEGLWDDFSFCVEFPTLSALVVGGALLEIAAQVTRQQTMETLGGAVLESTPRRFAGIEAIGGATLDSVATVTQLPGAEIVGGLLGELSLIERLAGAEVVGGGFLETEPLVERVLNAEVIGGAILDGGRGRFAEVWGGATLDTSGIAIQLPNSEILGGAIADLISEAIALVGAEALAGAVGEVAGEIMLLPGSEIMGGALSDLSLVERLTAAQADAGALLETLATKMVGRFAEILSGGILETTGAAIPIAAAELIGGVLASIEATQRMSAEVPGGGLLEVEPFRLAGDLLGGALASVTVCTILKLDEPFTIDIEFVHHSPVNADLLVQVGGYRECDDALRFCCAPTLRVRRFDDVTGADTIVYADSMSQYSGNQTWFHTVPGAFLPAGAYRIEVCACALQEVTPDVDVVVQRELRGVELLLVGATGGNDDCPECPDGVTVGP